MSVSRPGDPRQVGPYRIVGRLGAGGMGQVLLGRSPSGRTVAVKVIHPAMAEDDDFRARFRREITAARAVGGVYTAPVVDADPDASPPWLATTFLRGMSLQDAVAAHGPLPPPAVRALGAALAEALRSVHGAGIVHRDLKPSNVMLTPEGPRVIDFGIARPSEATTLTRTGATLGTPAYMSPEQASGQPAGPPSDVFSLGAVLTYAATGVGPFGQGAVHELVYRVIHLPPYLDGVPDPGLRALIAACMEKDPARRPTPERLLEHLSAEPAPAPQGTHWLPPPVAHDVARRGEATVPSGPGRRAFLALGAGVAAMVAGAGGLLFHLRPDDDPPLRWTYRLPEDVYVRSRLVATGDTVLTFGSQGLAGQTFAIDAETGEERWRGRFTVDRGSSAALFEGRGFVYDQASGELLTAFDLATGRTLWTEQLKTSGLTPRPAAGTGVVCMTGFERTGEYGLYGYDAATGRPLWRYRSDELTQTRAVLAGTTCWFGTRRGFVYAVDVTTGNARWQKRTGAAVLTDPILAGDVLAVITADGSVRGLDPATGRERWRTELGDGAATDAREGAPATIAGGVVFVDGLNGFLYAVDAATGRLRWKKKAGTEADKRTLREVSRPAVSGGLAVVTDEDWITAFDLATGATRWERHVERGRSEPPLISGSLVYYGTGRGMHVFDLHTGRTRHYHEFSRVLGSVEHYTELDGTVYCVADRAVHALRFTE